MDEWTIRSGDLEVELGLWEESGQRSTCQAGTASSGVRGGIPAPGEPSPPFSPAHALGQSRSIAATQSRAQPWDAHSHPEMGAGTRSPQPKNWREVTVQPAMQTSCLFFFFFCSLWMKLLLAMATLKSCTAKFQKKNNKRC